METDCAPPTRPRRCSAGPCRAWRVTVARKDRPFVSNPLWALLVCAVATAGCGDTAGLPAETEAVPPEGPFLLPDEPGLYPVGVRRSVHVNPERYHLYGNSFRTHPTAVWYPALRGSGRPNTVMDFLGELPEWAARRVDELPGRPGAPCETRQCRTHVTDQRLPSGRTAVSTQRPRPLRGAAYRV